MEQRERGERERMKWFYMTFCDVTLGGPPSDEERQRESGLSYRARSLPVVCPLRLFVTFAPRRCRWQREREGAGRGCTVDSAAL